MCSVNLNELLAGLPEISGAPREAIAITDITCDPNLCKPGTLYVAAESETVDSTRYGVRLDGREFIEKAVANGAAAIFTDPSIANAFTAPVITHEQPLRFLGEISSRFFGEQRPKNIALVTGTNGKTSTVNFCRMLWSEAGLKACSVGNLGGVCSDGTLVWDRDPTLSVPETVTMHRMFHTIAGRGFDNVALEATSHALFDYRLHGVKANIGAFTNLTRDHLDFHLDMEEYFRVKMLLFREVLAPGSYAVLNADAERFAPAKAVCEESRHQIISYGRNGAQVKLVESTTTADGQDLVLEVFGKHYQCKLNLFGEFQASNVLCALSIVIASGLNHVKAVELISRLGKVEGRLEIVAHSPAGGRIIVDYAHTPDGIRAALEACRSFTTGKVFVVFGCNGERDLGKRPEMGEIAVRLADVVIITDGHPRSEEPSNIRKDVLAGAAGAQEIAGRAEAIAAAIKQMGKDDTLLVAGMGHENFQSIGDQRVPYSDRETAQRIVSELNSTKV